MGKPSRDKGARREREIVALLNEIPGVKAERVPLSGAMGGSFSGDIEISISPNGVIDLHKYVAEVKARKNGEGFKVLEGWLGSNDVLILKRDRATPMVVLPWEIFARLIS